MTTPPLSSPSGEIIDEGWRSLEKMLGELRDLTHTASSPDDFYARLMQIVVGPLGLGGGVVWQRLANGSVQAIYQQCPDVIQLLDDRESQRFHLALVEIVGRTKQSQHAAARSTVQGIVNPTSCTLLFLPIVQGARSEYVLEFFTTERIASEALTGLLSVLEAVAHQASEYHRLELTRQLELQLSGNEQLRSFALRAHAQLNLMATAMTIVNEALLVLSCERAAVLQVIGRKARLLAISGSDGFERRSEVVRSLERLGAISAVAGPLQYPTTEELPVEIERPLAAYVDQGHAQQLHLIPLERMIFDRSDQESGEANAIVGILVLERFQGTDEVSSQQVIAQFSQHAAVALDNAVLAHRWLWFRWMSNWIGEGVIRKRARAWQRSALAGLCVLVIIASLWPVRFQLAATGRINPRVRQDIFAPAAGIVTEIHIREGEQVAEDAALLTLRSPALELQISELTGKRQATEAALASARSLRLHANSTEIERARSAADEEELKATLAGLAAQYEILDQQRRALVVRSPQAGKVITRDLQQRLMGRPVNPGDLLMRIAAVDAKWQLELDLPEYRLQDLLHAQQTQSQPLKIRYLIAAAPVESHHATLESIRDAAQLNDARQPVIPLIAALDSETPPDARPQATVYAQIACGHRPLAFVWLHDIWEAITIRWWQ